MIPPRRPEGHQPAAPRYSLRWTKPVSTVISVYFGIQGVDLAWSDESNFHRVILEKLSGAHGTRTTEMMRSVDDAGFSNGIVVAYWTDPTEYARWLASSDFRRWFESDELLRGEHGYWCEVIAVPYDRFETIYSAPGYRIGFGRTADSTIVPITKNGYFGAARDRVPVSAIDTLESPHGRALPRSNVATTFGHRLMAVVPHNATFLRSGQYWEGAGQEQLQDYMASLQPKLLRGMRYLAENAETTGCLSLRIMNNLNEDGSLRAETSVAAMMLSIEQLEEWAASHETHLDIYRHAIAMNRLHKEKREVVTWHELFVMSQGNLFEYVNCHPKTGLLQYATLWRPVK
jgi:aldoxime dehydratase